MVQAMIRISGDTNRVLNILKAKYGLKDKSQAIDAMASEYRENVLEPELKPAFVKKIKRMEKQGKFTHYKSLKALRKDIENARV